MMQIAHRNSLGDRARRIFGRPALLLALMLGFALPMGLAPQEARAESPVVTKVAHKKVVKKRKRRTVRRTRRTVRHRHHHHPRTTVVYSHHAPRRTVVRSRHHHRPEPENVVTRPKRRDGPFLGMGLGVVSIDNDLGSEGGTGVNFALGMREGNVALELGLLAAAQPVERRGDLVQDLTIGGVSADAKLYLPFSRTLEPYGLVGLGYYAVGTDEQDTDFDTSLNLGGGIDVRLTRSLAIGGRYTYHGFVFGGPESSVGDTDDTWTALGTLTVYF